MEKDNKIKTTPNGQKTANEYDDGNIPQVDLPQDIIPDEVPRKDDPVEMSKLKPSPLP